MAHYESLLKTAREKEDPMQIAEAHARLGQATFLLGDHFRALQHHQEAYERYQTIGVEAQAAAQLSQIASTYYFSQAGDLDKAQEAYQDAARRFSAIGMESEAAMNVNYSAYIEWAHGRKEVALSIHREALARFEVIDDLEGVATALSDIGFTLNSLQRYEEALAYSRRALSLEEELGKVLMQIPTLNNIGASYFGLGRLEEALTFAERSLALAEERRLLVRRSEATELLHRVQAELGDWQAGYRTLLEHKRLDDRLSISSEARKIVEADMAATGNCRRYRI